MDYQMHPTERPPTIAIVIPCFNEAESLPSTINVLLNILEQQISSQCIGNKSFLYFVDDGSNDDTWDILSGLHLHDRRIKGIKLLKNFGHQNALLAGLLSVTNKCDASISIDADLQQDPHAIKKFIQAYKQGSDIVMGVRSDRSSDSALKKLTASAFYKAISLMGIKIVPNHADYRLMSKKALQSLSDYSEPDIFLRALCAQLGFKTKIINFDVSHRRFGKSKYSPGKMIKLALSGITSFSVVPLRAIALLGFFIFFITIVMTIYVLIRTILIGDTVPGWASTTLPIYLLGGIQIFCLGLLGEYLAAVLNTVKKRPRFKIETELN